MSDPSSKTSETAAKKGILSAALLVFIEVTGGLVSGSLGLISSAFNTLMDFVAAVITFFAVRESSKPPDEIHMYGHEKIESAAAISEILLLVAVCSWVTYNAVSRLMFGVPPIELLWVALGTNFFSIGIDLFAYLNLKVSSKKRASESVEASALHFLNDLLIAFVVIFGLVLYNFGFLYADSVAALGIVVFVLYSSSSLVRESAAVLMDAAPLGIVEKLKVHILSVEGVEGCHRIRVRRAGSKFFVDAHVEIVGHLPLDRAHFVASKIEEQIESVLPNSDVLIHTEPRVSKDPLMVIRSMALQFHEIKGVHTIIVTTIGKKLSISFHLELEPEIPVKDAHEIANRLEERIKAELKDVSTIISHLEPTAEAMEPAAYGQEELSRLRDQIVQISQDFPKIRSIHEIEILTRDGRYSIRLHGTVDGSTSLDEAHEIVTQMEEKIKAIDEKVERVTIHCEPEEEKPLAGVHGKRQ